MRDSLFCEKQDNTALKSLEPRVRSSTGISTVLLFPFYEPMIKKNVESSSYILIFLEEFIITHT